MERLLEHILNIDTQNPPGNERVLAEWIAAYLSDAPCLVTVQHVAEGRANVVDRIKGRKIGGALLLNGHLDTVPYGNAGWATPPGTATRSGDPVFCKSDGNFDQTAAP